MPPLSSIHQCAPPTSTNSRLHDPRTPNQEIFTDATLGPNPHSWFLSYQLPNSVFYFLSGSTQCLLIDTLERVLTRLWSPPSISGAQDIHLSYPWCCVLRMPGQVGVCQVSRGEVLNPPLEYDLYLETDIWVFVQYHDRPQIHHSYCYDARTTLPESSTIMAANS